MEFRNVKIRISIILQIKTKSRYQIKTHQDKMEYQLSLKYLTNANLDEMS